MTSPDTLLDRLRRAIAGSVEAHRIMWESLERIDPDPDPHLHWEPTSAGWRLYGTIAPPCDVSRFG